MMDEMFNRDTLVISLCDISRDNKIKDPICIYICNCLPISGRRLMGTIWYLLIEITIHRINKGSSFSPSLIEIPVKA